MKDLAVIPAVGAIILLLGAVPADAGVDQRDIRSMHNFAQQQLEVSRTGTTGNWRNSVTGSRGQFTIITTGHEPGREPCRTYSWTIETLDGDGVEGRGTGCRQSAGKWKLDETRHIVEAHRADLDRNSAGPEKQAEPVKPTKPKPIKAPEETKEVAKAPKAKPSDDKTGEHETVEDRLETLVFQTPPRSVFAASADAFDERTR